MKFQESFLASPSATYPIVPMANGAYAQYVCASSVRPEIGQTATWLLISGTKSNQPARTDRFYERCASYEAAFFTCV